jgi:DNA-3-methyladenine glycosylase
VLIRALEPLAGIAEMRPLRPRAASDRQLTNGPAKLCQAFGITGLHNGVDLVRPPAGGVAIVDDAVAPPARPVVTTRIGLSAGAELPWRWYVAGNAYVSKVVGEPATVHNPGANRGRST